MKRYHVEILTILLVLTLGAMGAWAEPKDGPPADAIKLAMGLKARNINGLSFEIKPTVMVLNDKEATVKVHEEKDKGFVVSLTVRPKRLGSDQVDLQIGFSVVASGKEVTKKARFVTMLGQKGLFSVTDEKSGEFLELEVTPTLVKK